MRPVIEDYTELWISPVSSHAYSSTCVLIHWKAAWLLVKGSLLKTGSGQESWSPAKQGSCKVEHGRAPPCLPRSKASFSKALFAFCSLQQLNTTQKSFFLPFLCPYHFRFSLSLTRLLSDSWFNASVLKEIVCLIGLLGVFFKWVLTHPRRPRLWILLWHKLSGTCFQTSQSEGWAWNGNLNVCYSLIPLIHSNYNEYN